ncbi:MAG: ABC transporter ATP-binding protein [Candidatus Omnitrophica bacterium]|nr:ABC transporter ATP-binding protein [Candidatus Omnitrophota bacterium]
MAEPVLVADGLIRRFGDLTAVDDVSFRIEEGETYGLLGPNGAGKTTTIRVLMGLLRPTEGSAKVLGENPLGGNPKLLQRVGYVSDDRSMYRWMKVREALRFNAGLFEKWDNAYAEQLLVDLELSPNQKVKELSRGQVAKLALLCALAPRPELLILDEASSGLDPMVRRAILEKLIDVSSSQGTTIFLSSHLLEEVDRVAEKIAILARGRLVTVGEKDEVRNSLKRVVFNIGQEVSENGIAKDWVLANRAVGQEKQLIVRDLDEERLAFLKEALGHTPQVHEMTLEDVFAEYTMWGKTQ